MKHKIAQIHVATIYIASDVLRERKHHFPNHFTTSSCANAMNLAKISPRNVGDIVLLESQKGLRLLNIVIIIQNCINFIGLSKSRMKLLRILYTCIFFVVH